MGLKSYMNIFGMHQVMTAYGNGTADPHFLFVALDLYTNDVAPVPGTPLSALGLPTTPGYVRLDAGALAFPYFVDDKAVAHFDKPFGHTWVEPDGESFEAYGIVAVAGALVGENWVLCWPFDGPKTVEPAKNMTIVMGGCAFLADACPP